MASVATLLAEVRGCTLCAGHLPHPSPRNNPWLAKNPWFEAELVPLLRVRVADAQRRDT